MYYGAADTCDIANGIGVRVTLFVSGCTNRCKGCFQPETWDFEYGNLYTYEIEEKILDAIAPPYISGLTLLGGEPFEPENQRELVGLLRKMRRRYPHKTVWAYTGFTLENELSPGGRKYCEVTAEMLSMIDVLVDGRFVQEKKNLSLRFRGSENQRIIDLKSTLEKHRTILYME